MTTADTATPTIMDLLRDSTAELHKAAESHAMQRALVKGELPVERYADYLEQLWVVHTALERALVAAGDAEARLQGMAEAATMHTEHLATDLKAMGRDLGAIEPIASAKALAQSIEQDGATDPLLLAGHFYVLEGSMNGNQFIARAVRGAYGLTPDAGLSYLCSYGESQRPKWAAFKEQMNTLSFSQEEREGLVARAKSVFEGIGGISQELESRA